MTQEALIRRLQISCLGLDPVDPLRLLVDDVIAALAQTERTWVGLTDEDVQEVERWVEFKEEGSDRIQTPKLIRYIEAKLKEKNA